MKNIENQQDIRQEQKTEQFEEKQQSANRKQQDGEETSEDYSAQDGEGQFENNVAQDAVAAGKKKSGVGSGMIVGILLTLWLYWAARSCFAHSAAAA